MSTHTLFGERENSGRSVKTPDAAILCQVAQRFCIPFLPPGAELAAELAAEFDDVAIGLELEDIDEEQQQNEEQH